MVLNKRELKRLSNALYTAIDSEEALIDAHRTEHKFVEGVGAISVIPKEYKKITAQSERIIKSWKSLIVKIESELKK